MTDAKPEAGATPPGDRIAKVLARAGVCSRRDAERLIAEGRVKVDGRVLTSPALNVTRENRIEVDNEPLRQAEPTRLWLYHKPIGLVTSHKDPQGRPTVFDNLPAALPRVISVGRLDFNSEGLLLLTNDGELSRKLELPATGWTRRYRARIFGVPSTDVVEQLARGITVEGVAYGPIEAVVERTKGDNSWLMVSLREGKNREIRRAMEHFGFSVSRLIRIAYGPFQLGTLPEGAVKEVPPKVLREQLGQAKEDNKKMGETQAMRIVGGKHRGRELQAGPDKRIRPTADRTREALFNILQHGEAFRTASGPLPQGVRVLDAFAGTGALGLEALSRGARHVTFVDDHPDSVKLIRLNAGLLKEIPHVTILQRDAQMPGRAPSACQLVLLDPPYKSDLTAAAIVALNQNGWMDEGAVVVTEIAVKDTLPVPAGFKLVDERLYGAAKIVFLKREPTPEK